MGIMGVFRMRRNCHSCRRQFATVKHRKWSPSVRFADSKQTVSLKLVLLVEAAAFSSLLIGARVYGLKVPLQ